MTDVTGSFEQALYESSKVLAVRGRIVPATIAHLSLVAKLDDGSLVRGESRITARGGSIERIMIEPVDSRAHPEAVEAIDAADLIVIGPGSLYTSLVPEPAGPGYCGRHEPDAGPEGIRFANVATESGETDGYTVADHVLALQRHTFPDVVDIVVANSRPASHSPWLRCDACSYRPASRLRTSAWSQRTSWTASARPATTPPSWQI